PAPGLVGVPGFVGPHLASPGVRADRRDVFFTDPVAGLERETRRIAAGVAAPVVFLKAALLVPGAHDHEVALANGDTLLRGAGVEVGIGNGVAIIERLDALVTSDVEQHAAADHLVADVLDAVLPGAAGVDQ